jgi:3-oxosteroid 1-dehydrogenase
MTDWNHEVDVLVAGAGAAGLMGALVASVAGLDALVVEKTEYFGGTTAYSGGGCWVPNNRALKRDGMVDTPEDARTYLDAVLALNDDDVPEERRSTYLREGPRAIEFLEENAKEARFTWVKGYPDYHPEMPGGKPEGRQVQLRAVDGRVLGDERVKLRPPLRLAPQPFGMWILIHEARDLALIGRSWKARVLAVKLALRGLFAKLRGRKMVNGGGQMLIAALRASLLERKVPLWLESPLKELITDDSGAVIGAVVTKQGTDVRIRARGGVLLACGGFERNLEMRLQYQPQPTSNQWTMGAPGSTGDGIRAGLELGAAVDLMEDAWWGPGFLLPNGAGSFALNERQSAGSIIVNGAGRRYTNESAPYVNVTHAMYAGEASGTPHVPSWFVVDDTFHKRYKLGPFLPRQPIDAEWFRSGVAVKADTIRELAEKMGVPADELAATVERFNSSAASGVDVDFHRGESAYDVYYADPKVGPNPCLGPIQKGPFYAFKMVPSDLGTKGGLRTDARARVLREDASVIPNLYAAGNNSASVMGHEYPGPGSTIGPAITFAYLAAKDMEASLRAQQAGAVSS